MDATERTPEEWRRHAESLRKAAEDGRLLGKAYLAMANESLEERIRKRIAKDAAKQK